MAVENLGSAPMAKSSASKSSTSKSSAVKSSTAKNSSFSFAFLTEILSSPKVKPLAQRLHPSAVLGVMKNTFDDVSQELWSAASAVAPGRERPDRADRRAVARTGWNLRAPSRRQREDRLFEQYGAWRLPRSKSAWALSGLQTEYSRQRTRERARLKWRGSRARRRGGLCELRGGADRGPERAGQFRSEPGRGAARYVRARERGPARRSI